MAKKALLIGAGMVALLGIGTFLAAPPIIESCVNSALDAALLQANQHESVKVSRKTSRFDLWSRRLEIDDLVYEQASAYAAKVVVPKLTIEGINVLALTAEIFSGQPAPVDAVDAVRRFSAARVYAPTIEVEDRSLPGEVGKSTYRETIITDLKNGIAASLSIASAETQVPPDENITFEPMTFGSMRYEGIDIGLNLALLAPNAPRGDEMRPLFRSFTSEPIIMKGKAGDVALTLEIGGMTSDEMRVRPSAFDAERMMSAVSAIESAEARGETPPEDATHQVLTAVTDALLGVEMDRLAIDSFKMTVGGDQPGDVDLGPITIQGLKDGALLMLDMRDLHFEARGRRSLKASRYQLKNADFSGTLAFLRDKDMLNAIAEKQISPGDILRMLPRFEVVLEGLVQQENGDAVLEVAQQSLALTGPRGGLPSRFAFAMEGFSVPVPADDPRMDILKDFGIETLRGRLAYIMSYDDSASALKIDSVTADLDQLAALEGKLTLGKIDMTKLIDSPEAFAESLGEATFTKAQVKISDRNGGITRLMEKTAEERGGDLQTLKDELVVKAQVMGVLFLGGSAVEVMPALLKFIEDPKSITVTARPKNDAQPAAELYRSLHEGPQNIPNLLDFEAVAE
ncbi:hypothetical protein GCM10007276_20650 [Agaricicola taiwanensis]|uniref:Uncharacterized protein n=1 Tax=Agaricicola taiwanensis TaxID=591372 RepID=A0A8J2YHK3_9RHOB|nr:hypothetical protein [Agaricicola taiwanensis]GGE43256.1 hypothetical protein GCM10007276_20650 [Agaricicola taiwanensis]